MLKKYLRKLFKSKRAQLSEVEIEKRSIAITKQLIQLLNTMEYQSINCFLSSDDKKEIQTKSIVNELLKNNKTVSVPVSNYTDFSIVPCQINSISNFKPDEFGIPKPTVIEVVEPFSIDIILCPLLCFDQLGYRTGYGKGMYDRFIAKCRPDVITIGLSFFDPIDEIKDVDEFDRRLDYVVGVGKVWEF